MNSKTARLSTVDNPYNPFTQWEDWLNYDLTAQHDTCAVLSRHCYTSDMLTDEENRAEVNRAIDEIVAMDPTNQFIKVYEDGTVETKDSIGEHNLL